MTSSSLQYLLKLGSGKKGTVKGLVYASEEVGPGWVVFVDGVLLHRKPNPDGGAFCRMIDRDSFKVCVLTQQSETGVLVKCAMQLSNEVCLEGEPGEVLHTFQLLSDGKTLYWLYALQTQETIAHPVSGDKIKQHPLYLHSMHVEV